MPTDDELADDDCCWGSSDGGVTVPTNITFDGGTAAYLGQVEGAYGDGEYVTAVYRVEFAATIVRWTSAGTLSLATLQAHTHMRLNIPCPVDGDDMADVAGIVLFVAGARGTAVGVYEGDGEEDEALGYLASGADFEINGNVFGRSGPAMYTVTCNNPGYGDASMNRDATGHPWFEDHPTPNTDTGQEGYGDDYGGELTVACIEASVRAALAIISEIESRCRVSPEHRLLVWSFSNGVTAASRWLATTSQDVHAFVDVEGPTDSLEQTLSTWCYDHFPTVWSSSGPSLDRLEYAEWYTCASRTAEFARVWSYWFRPPRDVLESMRDDWDANGDIRLPGMSSATVGYAITWYGYDLFARDFSDFDPIVLDIIDRFWAVREAKSWLPLIDCAYIRVQGSHDHVQPEDEYRNLHAVKALNAAASADSVAIRTYYFGEDSYAAAWNDDPAVRDSNAPSLYDPSAVSVLRPSTFPDWPDFRFETDGETTANPVLCRSDTAADLLRWALGTEFAVLAPVWRRARPAVLPDSLVGRTAGLDLAALTGRTAPTFLSRKGA